LVEQLRRLAGRRQLRLHGRARPFAGREHLLAGRLQPRVPLPLGAVDPVTGTPTQITSVPAATAKPAGPPRWAIVGHGLIASEFADGVRASGTGELAGVASRAGETARRFADAYGVPTPHTGYEAILSDPRVDALYIATPHPMHAQWAIRGARA